MEAHKPKIPRVVAGIAMHALPLAPVEGFVLSRIDAVANLVDIADLTSLDLAEVTRIIDKLILLGAVEWADGTVHLPRTSAKSVAPPRPTAPRPSQLPPAKVSEVRSSPPAADPDAQRRPAPASAPPAPSVAKAPSPVADATPAAPAATSDGIELAPERRKRIDDLYVAIDLLDHYQMLGISHRAGKPEVRSAYFELSKVFHPDTAFRKNVGNYRQKMEAIFKRLTEAYEVLGKKKSREEYDAYLESIGTSRDAEEALSGENEIPEALRGPAAPASPPPVEGPPPAPPPQMPARTTPTDEGKRVARELLQKRLGAMRSGSGASVSASISSPGSAAAPSQPPPEPSAPVPERTKKEVLRDLTSSLKVSASHTGGVDRVTRLLAEAQAAENAGDLSGAVRAFRLAMALAPERQEIADAHARIAKQLAVSLAGQYEQQAHYEEKHQKWATAATNWAKVLEGRPDDVQALTRAAVTLLEAKGDLRQARNFAQRAVELAPEDAQAHLALGRIFHAAQLGLNARRELEIVRKLDPQNAIAQHLLKELATQG